jgi:hypothetical protein
MNIFKMLLANVSVSNRYYLVNKEKKSEVVRRSSFSLAS